MPRDDKGYNGWVNKETWLVYLWLSNDEASDRHWRAVGQDIGDTDAFAQAIRQALEEGADAITMSFGLYTDLLNTALAQVDWDEVARHFLER